MPGSTRRGASRARQDLAIGGRQLRDYQARSGKPFPHEEYLSQLAALRDRLKARLAGMPAEEGSGPVPVAELAERIKALKAGHKVEAPGERAGKRTVPSAEEPVTSRIRKRAAVLELGTDAPVTVGQAPSGLSHVERLAKDERKEREPGLC